MKRENYLVVSALLRLPVGRNIFCSERRDELTKIPSHRAYLTKPFSAESLMEPLERASAELVDAVATCQLSRGYC